MGTLGQRAVQADQVGFLQQFFQRNIAGKLFHFGVFVHVIAEHIHAKTVADARHGGANAAGAHNAGAGAIKVLAQQAVQCKVVIAHLDICLADAAVCGLGQRHGVLGNGFRAVARHTHNGNAVGFGGGKVHVIVARAAHQQQLDARFGQHGQRFGTAITVDKGADGIAARGQLGGIRVQVGRQELDGAAIVRVSGQNVKIQVVVITGAIKNDLHTFPFSALRASSCCGVPESFCFPAHSGSVVNILSYPTVLV